MDSKRLTNTLLAIIAACLVLLTAQNSFRGVGAQEKNLGPMTVRIVNPVEIVGKVNICDICAPISK